VKACVGNLFITSLGKKAARFYKIAKKAMK
jgi:hypothetical protein